MDSPAWGTELLGRQSLFINCHEAIKGWTAQEAIMQLKSHFCVIKYVGKGGKSPIKYWGNIVIKLIRFSQKSRHFNHIIFTMNGNLEQKLLILVGRKRVHLKVSACRRQRNSQNTASIYWPFFSPWMVFLKEPVCEIIKICHCHSVWFSIRVGRWSVSWQLFVSLYVKCGESREVRTKKVNKYKVPIGVAHDKPTSDIELSSYCWLFNSRLKTNRICEEWRDGRSH